VGLPLKFPAGTDDVNSVDSLPDGGPFPL
jgi:hypothetical protein